MQSMPTPAAASTTASPRLPGGIEIFAAGTRTADDGSVHTITPADLAASVAAYDPAVHEAPHVVGHPQHNGPAYGWVGRLGLQGDVLTIAEHNQVEPQFAELVAAGRVKKRSASFYHPEDPHNPKPGIWYLRHVGWLGAQPPAIKGLKDVAFSEGAGAGGAVCFSEPATTTTQESKPMDEEEVKALKAELEQARQETARARQEAADEKSRAASFAEQARAERKAGFVSFAESQVEAGRLLPKDKGMAVATLEVLADVQPVEFAEGTATTRVSPSQWLQNLISGGKPQVDFGEFAGGKAPGTGQAKGKSDAEIDQAAQGYMRQHKVNYAEALTAVTASFAG